MQKKVLRGSYKKAFSHTGRMGKKQILNWDRASQNRPSSRGREKQEALSC